MKREQSARREKMLQTLEMLIRQEEGLAEPLLASVSMTEDSPVGDMSKPLPARLISPTPIPKRLEGGASAQEL